MSTGSRQDLIDQDMRVEIEADAVVAPRAPSRARKSARKSRRTGRG